jgi:hypothetical protein
MNIRDIIIGLVFTGLVLAGIIVITKRFLKPGKGPLPDGMYAYRCNGIITIRSLSQNP